MGREQKISYLNARM